MEAAGLLFVLLILAQSSAGSDDKLNVLLILGEFVYGGHVTALFHCGELCN